MQPRRHRAGNNITQLCRRRLCRRHARRLERPSPIRLRDPVGLGLGRPTRHPIEGVLHGHQQHCAHADREHRQPGRHHPG